MGGLIFQAPSEPYCDNKQVLVWQGLTSIQGLAGPCQSNKKRAAPLHKNWYVFVNRIGERLRGSPGALPRERASIDPKELEAVVGAFTGSRRTCTIFAK